MNPFPELPEIETKILNIGGDNNNMNNNQINNQNNSNINNSQLSNDDFTKVKLNLMGIAFSTLVKEENKSNGGNYNEEITITFSFAKGPSIYFKTKLGKIFKDVVQDFSNVNEIIKKYEPVALHNCNLINFDKTLFENNIKNGDYVLFFRKIEKDGENVQITEDEKIQLERWLAEYKANKLCEYLSSINTSKNKKDIPPMDNQINIDEFIAFVLYKDRECGIKVREHEHKLVYCLTLFDWKCNKCNKNYDKNKGKYYCSFCDYSMCDNCRAAGSYEKKREFPKNIPPPGVNYNIKFLKSSSHHEDNLVFCRTSRIVLGRTYWFCNGCRQKYDDDVWSFYCTKCDYDLCSNCAGIH
jgi:hypothetical protein